MIDLDSVSYYLKLSIIRTDDELIIFNQKHYFEKVFKRFEMKNCTFVSIFINSDVFEFIFSSFSSYSAFKETFHWYDLTIRSINFAIIMTRFDIFYAVFIISRHCNNPGQKHVKLMTELFRYIKKIIDYGIIYQMNGSFFLNYVDFDFVEIVNDKRFTTEWIFSFVGGPIFWNFKKQDIITLFICETKYHALNEVEKKTIWLRHFFIEINVFFDISITLFVNNKKTKIIIENLKFHCRTKHIDVRYHWIRKMIENNIINFE